MRGDAVYQSADISPVDGPTVADAFSGIGGFSDAFASSGFKVLWRCEIDRQCNDVARFHNPEGLTFTDINALDPEMVPCPDVFTFGSPCQGLSVAGRGEGLADPRSNLFYEAIRVIRGLRDRGLRIAIWENVEGALHCNGGEDFRQALFAILELGPLDVAWAVLDSQWFGVAQRRNRVFTVIDFEGERAGEILALSYGLSGHPAPRRQTWARVAACLTSGSSSGGVSAPGRHREDDENLVPSIAGTLGGGSGSRGFVNSPDVCGAFIPAHSMTLMGKSNCSHDPTLETYIPQVSHTLRGDGFDASEDGTGRGTPIIPFDTKQLTSKENRSTCKVGDPCGTLHGFPTHSIASNGALPMVAVETGHGFWTESETGATLRAEGENRPSRPSHVVRSGWSVRRLTPLECERLQGFPDEWTRYGRKEDGTIYEMADGPRYRMLGNAVTRTVGMWLAKQTKAVLEVGN